MVLFCSLPPHQWRWIYLPFLLCVAVPAAADDLSVIPYLPNFVSADYGIDSDDGDNLFLFANLRLVARQRLSLGYGRYEDTVSGSREELDSTTYLLGYSYRSQRQIQYGAEYEYWGDSDRITTDTLSVYVSMNMKSWSLSVTPQIRRIDVYSDTNCGGSIDNSAVALDVSYYANTNWSVGGGYTSYDYHDYDELLNCDDLDENALIVSRLQTVADDNQWSISADYFFDTESVGMNWLRNESAIDGSLTKVISLYVTTDRFSDWTITLTMGRQENLDNTTTEFLNGTVGYYW
jgi:hypothetical protein